MRIAVLSDSHIDHGVHGFDAHDAWNAATSWILEHEVELVVVAGDMFHTGRTEGIPINVAGDAFVSYAKADIPVLIVVGNHEWIGARPAATGKCLPIEVYDGYAKVRVVRKPRLVRVPGSDLVVATMPWPEPGQGADSVEDAAARMADKALQHDGPRIAVAHAAVEGASVKTRRGSELDLWRFASEPVVSLSAIDNQEAFFHTALGHVHRRQSLSDTCSYVGSTEAMSFSDEGMTKGFSLFELDEANNRWTEKLIPVGVRSFLTVYVGGEHDPEDQLLDMAPGTLVRLRVDPNDSGTGEIAQVRALIREHGGKIVDTAYEETETSAAEETDNLEDWMAEEGNGDLAHFEMNLPDLMDRWYEHAEVPEPDRPPVSDLVEHVQSGAA